MIAGDLFPRAAGGETSVQPSSKSTLSYPGSYPLGPAILSLFTCILTHFPQWKKTKDEFKQAVETAQKEKYVHGRMLQIGSSSFTYVTPGKLPRTAHFSRHTSCRCSRLLLEYTSVLSSFSLSFNPPFAPRFPSAYFIFSKIYGNIKMTYYVSVCVSHLNKHPKALQSISTLKNEISNILLKQISLQKKDLSCQDF